MNIFPKIRKMLKGNVPSKLFTLSPFCGKLNVRSILNLTTGSTLSIVNFIHPTLLYHCVDVSFVLCSAARRLRMPISILFRINNVNLICSIRRKAAISIRNSVLAPLPASTHSPNLSTVWHFSVCVNIFLAYKASGQHSVTYRRVAPLTMPEH